MGPKQAKFEKMVVTFIFLIAITIFWIASPSLTKAGSSAVPPLQIAYLAPIYTDPTRAIGSASTTPAVYLADPSDVHEQAIQQLLITNTDSTDTLYVYWVATGASCGSAPTGSGDIILPNMQIVKNVAGDMRSCFLGSASPTTFHVSRKKVE